MKGDDNRPDLSIIVPVFNGIDFISATLSCLERLEQVVDCEIIFQNCCSSDGTSELLEEFCTRSSGRFHICEQDDGQSDAINRGMDKARGHWLTWLCADDLLLPSLAQALDAANHVEADLVYGDVVFVDADKVYPAIGTETHQRGILAGKRLTIQQPGTCIRRRAWHEAGGVMNYLNWSMDYDLFMRLDGLGKKFLRVKIFLAVILVHPEAKTSSGSIKRLLELWSVLRKNHRAQPSFFRFRPYIVYGSEYIIKVLESGRSRWAYFLLRPFLWLLHRLFWVLAGPLEQQEIQERFRQEKEKLESMARPLMHGNV